MQLLLTLLKPSSLQPVECFTRWHLQVVDRVMWRICLRWVLQQPFSSTHQYSCGSMDSGESSYYSTEYSDDEYSDDYYYGQQEHSRADELPDPEKDKTAIFLGEFSAPVKATRGNTINSIKALLISCGICYRPGVSLSKLCLDNLFSVSSGNRKPKYLTFDLPTGNLGDAEEQTVIVLLEVMRPGFQTLSCYVEVPVTCSPAELRQQCQQQLSQALDQVPHTVVLLWLDETSSGGHSVITAVAEDEVINSKELDDTRPEFSHKRLLLCWLPKPPADKDKSTSAPDDPVTYYSTQYVLVQQVQWNRRNSNCHLLPLKDNMVNGGAKHHRELQTDLLNLLQREYRQPYGHYPSTPSQQLHFVRGHYSGNHPAPRTAAASFSKAGQPTWICPDLIQHMFVEGSQAYGYHYYSLGSRDLDHPNQSQLAYEIEAREDARVARGILQRRIKLLRRLPLYDVVSELRLAARKPHSSYMVGSAARPACAVKLTLECPDPAQPRQGVACFKVYTWQNSTAAHGSLLSNPATLSTGANNLLSSGLLLGFYGGEDVVSDSGLTGSDSDFEDLVVMPDWVRQLREGTLQVPQQFRTLFEAPYAAAAAGQAAAPDSSVAAAADAAADAAELAAPAGVADVVEAPDIDPALVKAERLRRLYRMGSKGSFSLRMTLRLLAQHDTRLQGMYESWMDSMDAWWKAEKNVKGLLNMLKTGPCEAAPQPAGLSVTLHPHQRQTLFRLLAREHDPLGFNGLLWSSFKNSDQQWWMSLILGKLSLQAPPPTVTGGFLADEMGLGKTISILALILANPAPEEHVTLPQQQQPAPAGAATTSRQAALQSGEPIVTKPGQRLPVPESRAGSSRHATVHTENGTVAADKGQGKKGAKGKNAGRKASAAAAAAGKKGRKRKRSAADTDSDDADAGDNSPAAADTADGSTRGRGRGRGRGRVRGRGTKRSGSVPAAAVAAVQHLMAGDVQEAMEDFLKSEADEGAELDAAAAAALRRVEGTGLLYSRATLVVCAVSLVGQWMDEAMDKTQGSLKIYKYHGPSRDKVTLQQLAAGYDVVVTTYQTLVSDRSQHEKPPLEQIQWWRVVFDEGHVLKNPASATTKTAVALSSRNRWVVTGTPISSDVGDLSGQMAALQLWPFNVQSWFIDNCKNPFTRQFIHNPGNRICSPLPLVHIMRHIMTRHTKDQELEGQAVLQLPNKTVTNVPVVLNTEETAVYKEVYGRVRNVWLTLAAAGPGTINKHLLQAMSLLLPLRRICSGGRLSRSDMQVRDIDLSQAAHVPASPQALAAAAAATSSLLTAGLPSAGITAPAEEECVVCLDCLEVPVVTPCGHWFCKECIVSCLQTKHNCPLCRAPLAHKDLRAGLQPAEKDAVAEDWAAAAAGEQLGEIVVCDSKLKVLLKELSAMRAHDPTSKALVFTQYNSTLEWLKKALPAAGFGYRSISGSMPLNQRTKAIEAFQRDPPTTVFLLSVRSGAVGINLTAASHVFLLEPCLNPALEEQAIGRAWRMGQKREVVVKRLFVKGSIEERIMALAESRRTGAHLPGTSRWADTASAAAAAGPSTAGRAGGSAASAQQQLAGAIKADTQKLRAAELEGLFAPPILPQPVQLPQRSPVAAATAAAGREAAAATGAGPSSGSPAAANGYAEDSSAAAVAAAAAAAAGSSAAAALAAAAGEGSPGCAACDPQDLEIERQLALAGLLVGSKRAAAWADEVAAAGAAGAGAGAAARSRRAASRDRRLSRGNHPAAAAAANGDIDHDAAAEAAGRRRGRPQRQQQQDPQQQRQQRRRLSSAAQLQYAAGGSSDEDESSSSSSSESDADPGTRRPARAASEGEQQKQKKKQPEGSSSDGDSDEEYSGVPSEPYPDSDEIDSAPSDSRESDRGRRRSSSIGAAVGAAFGWMAAAINGRGRQPAIAAASASDSESSESETEHESTDGDDAGKQQQELQRQGRAPSTARGRRRKSSTSDNDDEGAATAAGSRGRQRRGSTGARGGRQQPAKRGRRS